MSLKNAIKKVGGFVALSALFWSFPAWAQSPVDTIDADSYLNEDTSSNSYESAYQPAPQAEAKADSAEDWVPLTTHVFVDGFYMMDWNGPKNPAAASDLPHRAYDSAHGFALGFAGIDVRYEKDAVGLSLDLRYGEGASRYIQNDDAVYAVGKQAFATWKPTEELTLDLGQFDTIYGGEVTDSWPNLNYSRGALYYLQPFYHTGLRATYDIEGMVSVTGLLVNGTNSLPLDNNQTPHVGLQLGATPNPDLAVNLGYYTGAQTSGYGRLPDGEDESDWRSSDEGWEHMVDLVVQYDLAGVLLVANGTWIRSGQLEDQCVTLNKQRVCGSTDFLGGSLAAGYAFNAELRGALRLESIQDESRYISGVYGRLSTATATVDYRPVNHLVLRLEHRFETADAEVFAASDTVQDTWQATSLSMVVMTGE